MTEYSMQLVSCLDPLRYLFDRLVLMRKLMRWPVLLIDFDIQYVTQKSIKGSVLADHLALLPVTNSSVINDDFPNEENARVTSLCGWRMYFDGATNHSRYGISIFESLSDYKQHC